MPGKRPNEPIAPTTIPGQPLDPKIPLNQRPDGDEHLENGKTALSTSALEATPDVSSDRVGADDAQTADARTKTPPLGIQEIESLEDDAKGG
jgi:hypothetical protein